MPTPVGMSSMGLATIISQQDTSAAALSQIIAELSQISANQSHFKEGLEKLNDNQQQLHNQNIITADLVTGLLQDVKQVKTHIKQEVGAAKQYTHSLFNNLKLELNPQINQIAEWQSKLELQFCQDHNLPTPDPFCIYSTPVQKPATDKHRFHAIKYCYTCIG